MKVFIAAFGVLLVAAVPAAATKAFDQCVRQLCTSIKQEKCWIKAGAALCDKDQIQCRNLPEHAPAVAIRKVGNRWEVSTAYGKGWVSDRMTMVDGTACPL